MKYVVTAISRLSGGREVISNPKSKEETERLCSRLKAVRPGKRAWLKPHVEQVQSHEMKLEFQQ